MFPEPGLQNSFLAVDPETALVFSSTPPSHNPGSVLPTQGPSDQTGEHSGTWWELNLSMHVVLGRRTNNPTMDFEVDLYPSASLLNKVLEVVLSIQGLDRIHVYQCSWLTSMPSVNSTADPVKALMN